MISEISLISQESRAYEKAPILYIDRKVNSEFDLLGNFDQKSTIANQIKNTIKNTLSTIKSTISDSFHKVYQPVKLLGISRVTR
jgi:hypothetical protein